VIMSEMPPVAPGVIHIQLFQSLLHKYICLEQI
jgi:hypothetical protein